MQCDNRSLSHKTPGGSLLLIAVCLASSGTVQAQADAAELPSVLVMGARVAPGIGEGIDGEAITGLISSEFATSGRYQVMSQQDVAAMLDNETQKQLAGCDDTGCIAEIGAAIGAQYLVSIQVAQAGESVVLSASLIDSQEAKVAERKSVVLQDRRQVAEGAQVLAKRLLGQQAELTPLPDEGGADVGWLKWPALGGGALLAAAGGAGTGLALMFQGQANDATEQTAFDDARQGGEISNIVAVSGYVAGGVLLTAAAALFVVDALSGGEAASEEGAS